ncbi:MAG: hypothetical protein KDC95_11980 [Planctomycetes bacterium]|nr:hypothetical protein [Planctomycetota bacterium]
MSVDFVDGLVLACYASLWFEVFVWRVPSVASTYEIVRASDRSFARSALELASTILGVSAYCAPMYFALFGIPAWCVPFSVSPVAVWTIVGVLLAISGRVLTMFAIGRLRIAVRDGTVENRWPYGWSRNPALVGLYVFFAGACLVYPCVLTLVGLVVFVLHMHRRVLLEETVLDQLHGDSYRAYASRVRRYL